MYVLMDKPVYQLIEVLLYKNRTVDFFNNNFKLEFENNLADEVLKYALGSWTREAICIIDTVVGSAK